MKPSDFPITNFSDLALQPDALCVGVRPYKDYKNGVAGEIAGFSYDLVLPARKYEHISLKIAGDALISPELFNTSNMAVRVEKIEDFSARWYRTANMTDYALSCKASSFTLAKENIS